VALSGIVGVGVDFCVVLGEVRVIGCTGRAHTCTHTHSHAHADARPHARRHVQAYHTHVRARTRMQTDTQTHTRNARVRTRGRPAGKGGGPAAVARPPVAKSAGASCRSVRSCQRGAAQTSRPEVAAMGASPTSAPGLGLPLPSPLPDWARPCHICTETGLVPCHICVETGLTPATSAPGLRHPAPRKGRVRARPRRRAAHCSSGSASTACRRQGI
jgi:hypothetical protein